MWYPETPAFQSHESNPAILDGERGLCGPRDSPEIAAGRFSASPDAARALFAPLHYESNYAYPLIVWLHGANDDERQLKRIMPFVSLRNYVAVSPRGTVAADSRAEDRKPADGIGPHAKAGETTRGDAGRRRLWLGANGRAYSAGRESGVGSRGSCPASVEHFSTGGSFWPDSAAAGRWPFASP